jgi:RNA polymerase sigma factor (sigma-70 family)
MHSNTEAAPGPAEVEAGLDAAIAAELPRLRRHARSLVYNAADADDLVQDCLETALAKQGALQDRARLRSWLFAILNSRFLMGLRSNARRGAVLPIEEFAESLAAAGAPEDGDLARDLARAMGRLSAEHRQILLLVNVEGLSYEEAAAVLGVPTGTVMSRLARARQRVRALLEGGGELRAVGEAPRRGSSAS